MSGAFVGAIERFSESNDKLVDNLSKIETALEASSSRSDEQLAYYVAQAREIIDHSMMSQKGLIEEINQMAVKRAEEAGA
jgi:Holliday junction resolvasome RuvABC endonuclease subunit